MDKVFINILWDANLMNEDHMPYKLLMGYKPVVSNLLPNVLIQYAEQHERSIE